MTIRVIKNGRWLLFSGCLLSGAVGRAAPALLPPPPPPTLEFIQNRGQWDARARYMAPLPGGKLVLGPQGLTYVLADRTALARHGHAREAAAGPLRNDLPLHTYTVSFVAANPAPALTAATPTTETRNYFIGSDEHSWASQVPSFRRLHYAGVWPGIGVSLYENAGQHLEYDVEVAPRANPARVALRYAGADALALDGEGNLLIQTSVGAVRELAPQAWQTDRRGQRQAVACRFVLKNNVVSFALGPYDRHRALTIDPTVLFASSTGSTADNWGFTATYDQAGNLYSGGIVFDYGVPNNGSYPATPGAYSTQFSSVMDIGLIKYNPAVTGPAARVWATYLGGNSSDLPHSLVVNAQNELVVLGSTSSTNYPTTAGALSRSFGGGQYLDPFGDGPPYDMPNGTDLVVTRLGANGNRLAASTYLGGSDNDGVLPPVQTTSFSLARNYGDNFRGDVLLDPAGTVYVASSTASTSFPGVAGGLGGRYHGGSSDAVVCLLPPDLGSVRTALLGGSRADAAYSLQRDAQGRIFVAGGTASPDFPTTAGCYQPRALGDVDGFALCLNPTATALEAATYLGTSSYDQAYFLQLDGSGDPYVLGQTQGRPLPTPGHYAVAGAGQFVQKLTADLSASAFVSTFGTARGIDLVPTAFLVDECERVYVCGWGGSVNSGNLGGSTDGLPTTAGAVQTYTDGSDFYLAEFTPGMAALEYATFLGEDGGRSGEHVDGGTSRFDRRGVVYQAVCGGCGGGPGFPVPPGANTYSAQNRSSNCNNAAFKMDFGRQQADPGPRRAVCPDAGAVPLGGTPAGGTWSGPGVRAAAGGGYEFVPAVVGPGRYVLTYAVATTGICLSTKYVTWLVPGPAAARFAPLPGQCLSGAAVALAAVPAGGTFSGPGVTGRTFSPQVAGLGTHTLTYTVCDSVAGGGVVTQQVVVQAAPVVQAGRDTTLCADLLQPYQLQGFAPADGVWGGPGVSATGYFTPPDTHNRGGNFDLTYTVTHPPCITVARRRVTLAPASLTDVPLDLPVCPAAPQFAGLAPFAPAFAPQLAGGSYVWDFGDGSPTSTETNPRHRYEQPGSYLVKLTARYAGCEVHTQFAPLEVGAVNVPNIITPNGDGLNETFRPRFSCRPTSLKVFSRWGQEVFRSADYHNDWNASGLGSGIYYYLLQDDEQRAVKGWVEVVR